MLRLQTQLQVIEDSMPFPDAALTDIQAYSEAVTSLTAHLLPLEQPMDHEVVIHDTLSCEVGPTLHFKLATHISNIQGIPSWATLDS